MTKVNDLVPGTKPSTFLDAMAAGSRERVAAARRDEPDAALRRRLRSVAPAPRLCVGSFALIAEIKPAAPSSDAPPVEARVAERVREYVAGGAVAISVLTEPTRFGGALAHLRDAAAAAGGQVPVMRKDFVVDPYQVLEARAAGAGGVLLIAELIDDATLDDCTATAQALGMFVLIEAFGAIHAERVRTRATSPDDPAPVLCGINCRDLRTLRVDPERFAARAPTDRVTATIAESGLHSAADVEAVARLGYRGALVGTALMRAPDPAATVAAMVAAGRRGRCTSA